MPNPIKYNTSTETLSLKKGNFWIGTGDVGKGPTSTTGFYNGITPPSGGYTIYVNKATGGPSIRVANNNTELITITNQIAGTSYTTVNECFNYFAGQSDKMVVQRDYEGIVTNGLVLNLDAGYLPSYPQNGTSWYDLGPSGNTGTLTNGPTFNSGNGGSIVFDGVNDYVTPTGLTDAFLQSNWTISFWVNFDVIDTTSCCNDKTLIQHGTSALRRGLHLSQRNRRIHFGLYSDDLQGLKVLSASTWYNIVFVLNNTSFLQQIYINGTLDNSRTAGGAYIGTGNNTRIGGVVLTFGTYFDGFMSYCNAYNRTLSASEITQNYNALKDRYGL